MNSLIKGYFGYRYTGVLNWRWLMSKRAKLILLYVMVMGPLLFVFLRLIRIPPTDVSLLQRKLWLQARHQIIRTAPNQLVNLSQLDCGEVLAKNTEYIQHFNTEFGRIVLSDPIDEVNLQMDCESIRKRNHFPTIADKESREYPLAYARIINTHYLFVEMELSKAFSPANWYCFAVDANSDALFKKRMKSLSACLSNIILVEEFAIPHGGYNTTVAHLKCMELLETDDKHWEYIALLENYDVNIRTNREAIQVYKWMDGANDVKIDKVPQDGRVDESKDWSFQALNLFRNGATLNTAVADPILGYPPRLRFSNGYVQASFTRAAVRFMLKELDLTEMIKRFIEAKANATDELTFPTLSATDAIHLPGGFTHLCLEKDQAVETLTRFSKWKLLDPTCTTNFYRQEICVYGLEDLAWLDTLPFLFVNQMFPEFDFGAAFCLAEALFNRSMLSESEDGLQSSMERIESFQDAYANRPQVRFQAVKRELVGRLAEHDPINENITKLYEEAMSEFDCGNSIFP